MDHRSLGSLGEDVAALFLASRGYRTVARNLRRGRREVDFVVERGALLVAVEVKWRRASTISVAPCTAWSAAQRHRARDVVLELMQEMPHAAARPWRFDLITIAESPRGWDVVHHRAVWSPHDSFW